MSLAGPKRKQKITADPNNKSWTVKSSVAYKYLRKYDIKQMKSKPVQMRKKLNTDGIGHQLHKETSCYLADLDALFSKKSQTQNKNGMNVQKLSIQAYFDRKKRGIVAL
eukprot:NODE_89_length_21810_cov_0.170098.p15 type:complete len:109 gc:universal NODE_89_length_21810_cov_0.170098:19433-19759(+)